MAGPQPPQGRPPAPREPRCDRQHLKISHVRLGAQRNQTNRSRALTSFQGGGVPRRPGRGTSLSDSDEHFRRAQRCKRRRRRWEHHRARADDEVFRTCRIEGVAYARGYAQLCITFHAQSARLRRSNNCCVTFSCRRIEPDRCSYALSRAWNVVSGLIFLVMGRMLLSRLLGCGQDREGPLGCEGRLLLGHAQQVRDGPRGRPANR